MRKILADRRYCECHLWFKPQGEEEGLLGLTDYAQARLGDLISAELPRVGVALASDDTLVYLEGLLEAAEVTCPANLQVLEINPRLEINPELINSSPYENGWIARVKFLGIPRWMDAPAYARYLENGSITEGA